jgi:hypothetical protein
VTTKQHKLQAELLSLTVFPSVSDRNVRFQVGKLPVLSHNLHQKRNQSTDFLVTPLNVVVPGLYIFISFLSPPIVDPSYLGSPGFKSWLRDRLS